MFKYRWKKDDKIQTNLEIFQLKSLRLITRYYVGQKQPGYQK